MIDHFQEQRTSRTGDTGQRAGNQVVDETWSQFGSDGVGSVRIEDFQEVAETLALGFLPESLQAAQCLDIEFQAVVECDGVQTEVDPIRSFLRVTVQVAALDVVDGGRAERARGFGMHAAAACDMDVCRVVGPGRGRDGRVVEQTLFQHKKFTGAGRHQRDVDDALPDDVTDLLPVLGEGPETDLTVVPFRRPAGSPHAEGHVGVLRIGDDEFLRARRIGMNGPQFSIERLFHESAC